MDKAQEARFAMIIEHYRDVAGRLGITLQELLLLVLSEQLADMVQAEE